MLFVGELIVIVDMNDIIYVGMEDGYVNVKIFDIFYLVSDMFVVIEKKLFDVDFICVY